MLPRLDVSGLVGKRVAEGSAVLIEVLDGHLVARPVAQYQDEWVTTGPARVPSWQEWIGGAWFAPVPICSAPSTRARAVAASQWNAHRVSGRVGDRTVSIGKTPPIRPAPPRPALHVLEQPRRRKRRLTVSHGRP